ncbi:M23 family metallopeptidase, partial [Campylobacter concisus]|uniref:M23 family metallopeptidase n=1 Tax=Campylobacter concisus TaxID=199 RepID=UPI00165334D8
INTTFDNKNIYVVYLKSDGTNNISAINKALQEREKNSEFKEGKKEEILLIYPHQSAQPTAPYQPKNTRLTIILASGNYLDCSNLNPSGNSSESRLILTNYKFNSYKTNYNASNIKFINPFTSKETILYKDEVGNFISQDKKYSYNSANKIVLNFFDNLNFNLLNFAKENGSLRSDKASSMFDIKLKLASNNSSVPTTNNGNFNLVVTNLIITDENQNSTDIKEIYLHNGEDKRVYKSYYLKKNETTNDDELEKNSYTAKFNINLISDKNQGAFKKTTKFILAARDLSKDYSTSEIHSMSDNGVVSLEANQKQSGQATYELKTSLIDIANNIFNVTIDIPNKKDRTTITTKDTINLKAKYKPNKGDDNYKEINWSYKIIKKDEYNGEVRANIVINDIKLEGEKFKGKEINFTPQTDIKDQELLEKLKEDDSTIVFFACLKAPRYTTRYGKTHGKIDFKVPIKLKYENSKLYIYEFGHTDKNLGFDASLSDKFSCEINETKKSTNSGGKYYISSSINSQNIGIFKDYKLKDPAYQVISINGKSSRVSFEIYVADSKTKSIISGNKGGINLINNENKSKFISKFNEVKQRVKLENTDSVSLEVIEEDNEIIFPLKVKPLNDKDGIHSRYYWASAPGAHQASFGSGRSGGKRRHAGRDLYTLANAEIVAIADGVVLNTSFFYCKTNQVTVMHYFKGRKIIIRYGELVNIPVKAGDRVKKGQFLGQTGKLLNDRNQHINVVSGYTIYMIHFEYYTDGNNTKDPLTVRDPNNKFKRRSDLSDPLEILRIGYGNSFKTKK